VCKFYGGVPIVNSDIEFSILIYLGVYEWCDDCIPYVLNWLRY